MASPALFFVEEVFFGNCPTSPHPTSKSNGQSLRAPFLLVVSSCSTHYIVFNHLLIVYFSAEHVEGRIDAFLDEFGEILRSLSDEDFKSQVKKKFVTSSFH